VRAVIAESRVFASWSDYQEALIRAIAPLTPEQLQQRPLPTLRTPGEITAHIVYGRALHLTHSIGSAAAAVHPWLSWDVSTATDCYCYRRWTRSDMEVTCRNAAAGRTDRPSNR
jgi:hypothetical protein